MVRSWRLTWKSWKREEHTPRYITNRCVDSGQGSTTKCEYPVVSAAKKGNLTKENNAVLLVVFLLHGSDSYALESPKSQLNIEKAALGALYFKPIRYLPIRSAKRAPLQISNF